MVKNRRRDTGIAVLANGVKIPEATRDFLTAHNWQEPRRTKDSTTFDPNDATTKECEQQRFSGWRINEFTRNMELWCLGVMKVARRAQECTPTVMASMHEEAFATTGSLFSFDVKGSEVQRTTLDKLNRAQLRKARKG